MIGAVLDTNVLVSGLVGFTNPRSTPGQILVRWTYGLFELVSSEPILAELERTLDDPYFRARLRPEQRASDLALLRDKATLTPITATVRGVATHPEDDLVLATAVSAGADYLVTGDAPLRTKTGGVYQGVRLVNPREFLLLLDQPPGGPLLHPGT